MKERPILFKGEMVRAILSGRKTQTRRVVRPSSGPHTTEQVISTPDSLAAFIRHRCPYGQPGDRLWVRETFLPDPPADDDAWDDHTDTYVSWSGCGSRIDGVPPALRKPEHCIFHASWNGSDLVWRPSIHMPRWACRIVLEIVSVRVERLQDISRGDAMDEGCPFPNMADGDDPRQWFAGLWQTINGHESWQANPWVWVVEFKKVAA